MKAYACRCDFRQLSFSQQFSNHAIKDFGEKDGGPKSQRHAFTWLPPSYTFLDQKLYAVVTRVNRMGFQDSRFWSGFDRFILSSESTFHISKII